MPTFNPSSTHSFYCPLLAVLALLRNAGDVVLARKLLPAQGLMGAVLAHLVSDPPGAVLQVRAVGAGPGGRG